MKIQINGVNAKGSVFVTVNGSTICIIRRIFNPFISAINSGMNNKEFNELFKVVTSTKNGNEIDFLNFTKEGAKAYKLYTKELVKSITNNEPLLNADGQWVTFLMYYKEVY